MCHVITAVDSVDTIIIYCGILIWQTIIILLLIYYNSRVLEWKNGNILYDRVVCFFRQPETAFGQCDP